jgi:hypothetical protein
MQTCWSCYLDAAVKCTGVHEGQLLSLIGHDGSEIVGDFGFPHCWRGFSPDIVAIALLNMGWLAATYPGTIEEFRGETLIKATTIVNLRGLLIGIRKPVIYAVNDHAIGYTVDELETLPVQNPDYFTVFTKL